MRRLSWQLLLGLSLALASLALYMLHYAIYRDPHHIFIYLLGDIAFLPVEILLVTLIIHELLNEREKRARMEKQNMIIGAFFSEVGTALLARFSDLDPKLDQIRGELVMAGDWSARDFDAVSRRLKGYNYAVEVDEADLEGLRLLLAGKRDFLLQLVQNPSLLEHESFSELLRSVFHLTEELISRGEIGDLPSTDSRHMAGDINRAYVLLVHQWLGYMRHLSDEYPYLFSLAMRTNPFDREASPVVT
jgi:hypothetical protein